MPVFLEVPKLEHDDNCSTFTVEPQGRNVGEPTGTGQVRPPFDGYPQPVFPFPILHPPLLEGIL